jgi:phosphatidylglycerol lysyltransferase
VVAGNLITFVIGLFAVAGISFVIAPIHVPASFHLPTTSLRSVGVIFLVLVGAALVYAHYGSGVVRVRRWRLVLPRAGMLRSQLGVSAADWLLSSTALYVLMIAAGPVPFPEFLSGFLLAQIVTQVIPLPGGIGVFEAAILVLRPAEVSAPLATAALLVYRVVYYLVPLFLATAFLAAGASRKKKQNLTPAARVARELAPKLFATLTFIAGVMLLAFTALPEKSPGFKWLGDVLRLAVLEGSHFLGSLVGMGLVLLAFGLERRLRGAFNLTIGLLLIGIPAALLQAGDAVSATLLALLLLLLLTARDEFNRRIPIGSEPVNAGWVAAIIVVMGAMGWVGIYTQVHHQYAASLWWRFALDEHAPRALRIAVSVLIAVAVFVTARLISRARSHRSEERPHDRRPKTRGKKGKPG